MCQTGCGGCNDCGGLECGVGPAGLNGLNAFTVTTADFTVPNVSSDVTINVSALGQSTGVWALEDQYIFIEGAGSYKVVSSTATTITATNMGGANNAVPATLIAMGSGVSPSGRDGAGSNGVDGDDGVGILFQNISVSSPATIGSAYSDVVFSNAPITVPANTLENVGDMLRMEVMFQSDTDLDVPAMSGDNKFYAKVLFDGDMVWEGLVGQGSSSSLFNAFQLSLDMIVSATNTLSMRSNSGLRAFGARTLQQSLLTSTGIKYAAFTPPNNAAGTPISAISPNLAVSNAITVQFKNTTGNATHLASVTSILVTKFKKSQ